MPIIDNIDGPNRRIYLHTDTIGTDLQPMDIYKEMRELRRTDENLRKFDIFLEASGNVSKGGGRFTPRLVTCLQGTRIVPADQNHTLSVVGEIITDDEQSGVDCFDKTLLSPGVLVDIDYQPPQVEIIQVVSGSGVTEQDKLDIADRVWDEAASAHLTAGSMGELLHALENMIVGRVTRSGNIFTVHRRDNDEVFATFDLTDRERIPE